MALNTWSFLALAVAAILVTRWAPTLFLRKIAMLAFSIAFLATYVASARAVVVLATFLLAMYALGLPRVRTLIGWSGRMTFAVIALLWVFLFLVRDPNLFGALNPFNAAPVAIIGISYLVFRGISYLMESESASSASLLDFLNYMLFFPAILAGPIERFKDFSTHYAVPQGAPDDILPALHRIANGYIKKFVFADNLAAFGIASITDPAATALSVLWIAALIQPFLIYLDFSGYCDIAIGIGSLMGVKLRENFNRPFASMNIQEFWERWHISMTSLMRDYIFTPICKVIYTEAPRALHWPLIVAAYFFVMMLIALWHGTTTGFLLFGALHGAVLIAIQIRYHYRGRRASKATAGNRLMWMVLTYLFVSFTMVLWMAHDWLVYYKALFGALFR